MELVLLIGIPAAGKSTFFHEHFRDTHVRINLDMLRTRHRERLIVDACLAAKQPLVVDNTNLSRAERAVYIEPARAAGFDVAGYYFRSVLAESRVRNEARAETQRVPEAGLLGSAGRLERPSPTEGFTRLQYVSIGPAGFVVEEWTEP